jgi:hypothetical protein
MDIIVLVVVTVFGWIWFTLLLAQPEQWARFVDRYSWGVTRRFEKGLGLKILIGSSAVLGTVGLVIDFVNWTHTHR